jgi:hypothetical protein
MSKRPNVFDLDSLMVKKPEPVAAIPVTVEPVVAATPPAATPAPAVEKPKLVKAPPPPAMFRTSVYFSRAVHDKLRDIAHEERKTITDLINEGLDQVLTSRNYKTTTELRKK